MKRVVTYFENFFQSEENDENAEEIEHRRSQLSNQLSGNLTPAKFLKQPKCQSVFTLPTPTNSGNNSYKSTDNFDEDHVIWTEQEWLTILAVNDLNHTPHLELCGSLRDGIPEDLYFFFFQPYLFCLG